LGRQKGVTSLTAAQRWAVLLSAYCYDIEYKPTQAHGNADWLSRLPLPSFGKQEGPLGIDVFNNIIAELDAPSVTATQLRQATRRDRTLAKVWRYTKSGWPQKFSDYLTPHWVRRHELTIEGDCLMWGILV
jgi:hypothetical protein